MSNRYGNDVVTDGFPGTIGSDACGDDMRPVEAPWMPRPYSGSRYFRANSGLVEK